MTSLELPANFPKEESVISSVNSFKSALSMTGAPLRWESSDGEWSYHAFPMDDEVDFDEIERMTVHFVNTHFNAWHLMRIGKPDINGDVILDDFRLVPSMPLHSTRYELSQDLLIKDADGLNAALDDELETQKTLGANEPGPMDYAILEDAIADLQPLIKKAINDRMEDSLQRCVNCLDRLGVICDNTRYSINKRLRELADPLMDNGVDDPKALVEDAAKTVLAMGCSLPLEELKRQLIEPR
jgi:hypothetical protein